MLGSAVRCSVCSSLPYLESEGDWDDLDLDALAVQLRTPGTERASILDVEIMESCMVPFIFSIV